MNWHQGGSEVARGWYLDTRGLTVVNLPAGGRLPGQAGRSFVRVPWPAPLLLAPWIGGAFILVAPAIGLAAPACRFTSGYSWDKHGTPCAPSSRPSASTWT